MQKSSGLQKRTEHKRNRKAEFIRESAKVFVRLGLRDTTMDDVAEQLGVSKAVVYRYFSSKEDLVDAILENMTKKLLAQDRIPFDDYVSSLKRTTAVAREDPAAFLMLARDAKSDPVFSCHHQVIWQGVRKRLVTAFENWGLDSLHAEMSAEAMTAYSFNVQVYWIEHGVPEQDEAFEQWAAAGAHALDREWRTRFGARLRRGPKDPA